MRVVSCSPTVAMLGILAGVDLGRLILRSMSRLYSSFEFMYISSHVHGMEARLDNRLRPLSVSGTTDDPRKRSDWITT